MLYRAKNDHKAILIQVQNISLQCSGMHGKENFKIVVLGVKVTAVFRKFLGRLLGS